MQNLKSQKGFTLIELLIVVAILGILAAVVIPNVGRFLGRGEDEARRAEFHDVTTAVKKLREMSPLYEMAKEGIDLSTVQWAHH